MNITTLTQKIENLACRSKLIYKISMLYYKNMVKREVKLANIKSSDHVLVVGGGPCPHSGILIHKLTGAKVTIIDNVQSCVECSTQLVKELGISDYVKIILEDAARIETEKYSVIHVAMQITPKKAVLDRFSSTAKKGTKILVRVPKESVESLYSPIKASKEENYSKTGHGFFSNAGKTMMKTVGGRCFEKQAA